MEGLLRASNIPSRSSGNQAWTGIAVQTSMWGLSVGSYAKARRHTMKLAGLNNDEAYIGISYAIKHHEQRQFVQHVL